MKNSEISSTPINKSIFVPVVLRFLRLLVRCYRRPFHKQLLKPEMVVVSWPKKKRSLGMKISRSITQELINNGEVIFIKWVFEVEKVENCSEVILRWGSTIFDIDDGKRNC